MKILNRRVERRIELTSPGHMRSQWPKKLDTKILLPKRPDEGDPKEIEKIDICLRRKEEFRDAHLGGGYFKDFGNEIPPARGTSTETKPDTVSTQKATQDDTEPTVSTTPEQQNHHTGTGNIPSNPRTRIPRLINRRIRCPLCTDKPSH